MTERLPIFALGTVLFPGLVLPLHVFEERYRALVRDRRDDGTFGVVAIKHGWEVGESQELDLHDVGCMAEIRQITEHHDGRFDVVAVGRRRFLITKLHTDVAPYVIADIDWLDDSDNGAITPTADADPATDALIPGILAQFQRYLELIRTDEQLATEQLPDDPTVLSYLLAATAILTLDDRQRLLSLRTTRERLMAERRLLGRETALLQHVRAVPVPLSQYAIDPSDN